MLSEWRLIAKSLWYYRRTNAPLVLAVMLTAVVLAGALTVGRSVRASLRHVAQRRLGRTQLTLVRQDQPFGADLARRMTAALPRTDFAAMLRMTGTVWADAAPQRVQLSGVDEGFYDFSEQKLALEPGAAAVNERLATVLGIRAGDTMVLRLARPSWLPAEAPLTDVDLETAVRLRVAEIATEAQLGAFNLRADQMTPLNVFVDRAWLAERIEAPEMANVLLAAGRHDAFSTELVQEALRRCWQLEDGGLEVALLPSGEGVELRSRAVFVPAAALNAVRALDYAGLGVYTYFVNEIRHGERATPYSFVTALGSLDGESDDALAALVPAPWPQLPDGAIVLNEWLAEDLLAQPGATVELTYYQMGALRRLETGRRTLRVHSVVPMTHADATLTPMLPGLQEADTCADWDVSLDIDLDRVRDKDEAYWDTYGAAPKAFVNLSTGQDMWPSRYGDLTAMRFAMGSEDGEALQAALAEQLRARLQPGELGLLWQDVRGSAVAATKMVTDFGQLFLGLSFFLMAAAVLLTALLFALSIEGRAGQVGTLLALGFDHGQVRRLLQTETMVLVLVGALSGMLGALGYAQVMLRWMAGIWPDGAAANLQFYVSPAALLGGASVTVVIAWAAVHLVLRRFVRRTCRELLTQRGPSSALPSNKRPRPTAAVLLVLAAVVMVLGQWLLGAATPVMWFFGAGSCALVGGLALAPWCWEWAERRLAMRGFGAARLTLLNVARRRGRSLVTVVLIACGVFLIVAVGANRKVPADTTQRDSASGGFAYYAESALPVLHDLNETRGRRQYGLDPCALAGLQVIHLRVKDGAEASCLNLNRPATPRVLGVPAQRLDELGAFRFAQLTEADRREHPWQVLTEPLPDGAIPAMADAATIQWALGKQLGDDLVYADDHGRSVRLRLVGALAGSVLQGSVVIDVAAFDQHFGTAAGARAFLLDGTAAHERLLTRALGDLGFTTETTAARLQRFMAVENTYVAMFQVLGALGLLLGNVGLAVVVMRNCLERRSELALMNAVGFGAGELSRLLLAEYGGLALLGLLIGTVSACLAVAPALTSAAKAPPYLSLAGTLGLIAVTAVICVFAAGRLALRGGLVEALRND